MDYENETDLLYAVVTLPDPSSESGMQCSLYFIDEKKGSVLKTVPLPTWEPVSLNMIALDKVIPDYNCVKGEGREGGRERK